MPVPAKFVAILCDQHVLVINGHAVHIAYAWQSFLVNNFADFPDVQVKMI